MAGFYCARDSVLSGTTFVSMPCGGCTMAARVFPGRRISRARNTSSCAGWRAAHARTPDQAYGRRDRQDPQRQGARRTRALGWIPELIHHDTKAELCVASCDTAVTLARAKRHSLLILRRSGSCSTNSALLRAGDCRLARSRRARVSGFPALRLDYAGVARPADSVPSGARVVDDPELDSTHAFARPDCQQLEKSGVPALQTAKIKGFVPIGRSDGPVYTTMSLPPV